MLTARAINGTKLSHASKELAGGMGKKLITLQAIHPTASQRVQGGTKRPPGNRQRKRAKQALPKNTTHSFGNTNAGGSVATPTIELNAMENCTRVNEASSAIRSSDLRKKSTIPTRT